MAEPAPGQQGLDRSAWLLIIALTMVLAINIIDRQMMTVLAFAIGTDLKLSDSQLGVLGGIAFSASYFIFSLPWGWLADRSKANRVWVVSAALATWSAATALCGLTQSYTQLLLARMGVAAGEAGCTAPSKALIAELVPKSRLAWALSIWALGMPLGVLIGRPLGGYLAQIGDWKSAFLIVGVPGILFALLLTVVFRNYGSAHRVAASDISRPAVREALHQILRSRTLVYITLADIVMGALAMSAAFWGMMHFQRNLGLSAFDSGLWLGLLAGLSGIAGNLIGGWAADRFAAVRAAHYMKPAIIGMVLVTPFMFLAWSINTWWLAMLLLFVPYMADNLAVGGVSAAGQRLLSPRVRATATSMLGMVTFLLGPGLGVTLFGFVSDFVHAHFAATAQQSLRWTLMGSALLYLVPAVLYWLAGRHVEGELARFEMPDVSRNR